MKHKTRAPGSLDLHFGEKMRSRRVMMVPKVSQTDVGDALGLTFQQIQKYEKGTNRISAAMLVRIAAVLKVDVQYFFDELPSSAKNGKGIKTPVLIEMSLAYPRRCVMNSGSGQFRLPVAAPDRMSVCWHMPSAHRRYGKWTPGGLIAAGEKIGPSTAAFFQAVIEARPHPEQGFRT